MNTTPPEVNRTTYNAVVGRLLASYRETQGLEQAELAERLHMSQPSWSRIERGETNVTMEVLAKAALALNTSPGEIVDKTEQAKQGLEKLGIEVLLERPNKTSGEVVLALLAGAALGFLIAKVLSK